MVRLDRAGLGENWRQGIVRALDAIGAAVAAA
jgi:hypothetical protein